ncbi:MAG: hypothetical protein IJ389_06590 [Clostridia bacterium]|nr:hypothetical protein [Clostridia bacterium]
MDTDYLKRVGLYIVSAVISLGIIVYFGYHIWSTFKPDVKTEPVMQTTVTKTVDSQCYIFRHELPLSTDSAGVLVPTAAEGERVRSYGEAAAIYSDADAETIRRIKEIDVQTELLSEAAANGNMTFKDAAKTDNELYDVMTRIRQCLAKGDAEAANMLRQELISGVNKKEVIMGNSGDIEQKLSELKTERQELVESLGTKTGSVTTSKSGFYYSTSDGFETLFDPTVFASSDYETLRALTAESVPETASNAGKVVTDSRWYAVCFVDKGIGALMTEGESRKVSFPYNGLEIEMELENLIRGDDGYACVFSSDIIPDGFDYARTQPAEIALAEYTGFKVRISDVRMIDGKQGVYILDGSTVRFRLVVPITDHEGYYILETAPDTDSYPSDEEQTSDGETTDTGDNYPYLKLHDIIITEGTGLYDGRILGK